jgi:hypothetical protein
MYCPFRSQHIFSNILEASWCPFQKRLVVGGVSTPEQSGWRRRCPQTASLSSLKHLHHSNIRVRERHSSPYCCWSLWWISVDGTFSATRNLITMRCSMLHGTFCSLITLATPRQNWTGSNLSRREGGGCGFTQGRTAAAPCKVEREIFMEAQWMTKFCCSLLKHFDTLDTVKTLQFWYGLIIS